MRKKYSTAILLMAFLLLTIVTRDALGQDFILKPKYEYSTPELRAAQRLYSTQRYAEALTAFEAIIQKAEASQNYEEVVYAMEKKALALRRLERFDQVIETMDQAISLAIEKLPKDHFLIAKMYYTRGSTDHILRNYYKARSYQDTALTLYDRASSYDSSIYYRIVNYKYNGYRYSEGSPDTLRKYLDKLIELENWGDSNPSPNTILNLLQGYPRLFLQTGDFEQALSYAIEAYQYAIKNRDRTSNRYFAEAQYDLARVLYFKEEFKKALEVGLEAMPLVESTPRKQMPEYYAFNNLLGVIYSSLGEYQNALPYFQKAFEIPLDQGNAFQRRDKLIFHIQVIMNMGICYENLNDYERAKEYLDKSLALRKEVVSIPNPGFHSNYEYLGNFFFKQKEWNNALISYDSALRNGLVAYEGDITSFPEEEENFSYQDLSTLTKKAASLKESALATEEPSDLLISSKEYVQQIHTLLMASRNEFIATEGKLFLSQNFKSLYETGIDACFELYKSTGDERYFKDAMSFAKDSKAILFLEQSHEFNLVNNDLLAQEVKERFFNSKKKVEGLQKNFYQLINESLISDSVMVINNLLSDARSESQSLKDSIDLILADFEDNESLFQNLLDINEEVKLKKGEALIEFFYGEKNIYVLSKSAKAISFHKILIDEAIEESIRKVIEVSSIAPKAEDMDEDFVEFSKHSNLLYQYLIEPAIDDLGNDLTHLIIVPDEFLSRLPFEVFVKDISGAGGFNDLDYLIKSYSIQYELSSELLNIKANKRKSEYAMLGIGFQQSEAASTRSNYGSLPGTEREIRFLQSSFKGTYLMGDTGSKSDFLANARDYDILHLAIHGEADSLSLYESSLIFNGPTNENILRTDDLYLAGLQARLAVLSSCESGVGLINKGEGTFSIARGFALVGVPSIVMSLWKVNDRITSGLMVDMYRGFLEEGLPINEALRNSKLSYLERSDSYASHPYYWAAFLQLGQNTQLNEGTGISLLTIMLAVLPLMLLTFLIYRKRKRAI